jgi:hypothetical protein
VDEQREERESTEVEEEEQDGADQPEEYDVVSLTIVLDRLANRLF